MFQLITIKYFRKKKIPHFLKILISFSVIYFFENSRKYIFSVFHFFFFFKFSTYHICLEQSEEKVEQLIAYHMINCFLFRLCNIMCPRRKFKTKFVILFYRNRKIHKKKKCSKSKFWNLKLTDFTELINSAITTMHLMD